MTIPAYLNPLIREWGAQWDVPQLQDIVSVEFSDRMTVSLGRCQPSTGRVRLASWLLSEAPDLIEEVLCHELAHVAVRELYGPGKLPHGKEWAQLVSRAGFIPRTRAQVQVRHDNREGGRKKKSGDVHKKYFEYEHRCPVCQAVRFASRPVPFWHCSSCLEMGLPGTMEITRSVASAER